MAATTADVDRYRANRQDEIDSAAVYRAMAGREANPELATIYTRLAEVEERHLAFWDEQLRIAGVEPGRPRLTWRGKIMCRLARRFGARAVLPAMASMEELDQHVYDDQPETSGTPMRNQERSHARLLRFVVSGSPAGVAGGTLARLEGRHRTLGGNALRAAVLGANDGLTSNLSLVMGVAGAQFRSPVILVTGLTGLLAGACSMAMGEWISVQSSRELYQRQISTERDEIATIPDEEAEELSLIYQAKGLPEAQATAMAGALMADEAGALDVMAREELGLDPNGLGGSPVTAAASSFLLFAVGALVPMVPFFFLAGTAAAAASIAAAGVALFGIGALITLLTGRNALVAGLRQLLFGLAAAGVTYGLGRLIGLSIGT
ncbi:MAG TPA: VIT1/CCC1 transporter family protein [Acidimicrobiia bacterium]|nr:VIT1/CCC1 transporter family protein [Acidimicrobiia bacterium]